MMHKLPFESIKRDTLVKKDPSSDDQYKKADNKPVPELIQYGVVNIDKPPGPTSHQVSDFVQKILHIDKAGHSGTLDPQVTGVLPIALGKATRVVQTLLTAGKEYVGIMHMHKKVPEDHLKRILKKFTGKIKQMPPIKSSVKRQWRFREVYYIDILEIKDQDVLLRVGCEAGTYIRKLFHDIGKRMNIGAHMSELRRTKAGPFDESALFTLHDLADAYWYYKEEENEKYIRKIIQPVEDSVKHLPKVWALESSVKTLCHGANLKMPGIARLESGIGKDDSVAIMTLKNELIALGNAVVDSETILKQEKGIGIKTNKVFMEPKSAGL